MIQEPFKNVRPMNYENYHIQQVFDLSEISDEMAQEDNQIKNLFWFPNMNIVNMLVNYCLFQKKQRILEIGPGQTPFPLADTFVGLDEKQYGFISVNMNYEPIPFDNRYFDFLYTRHFLEDIEFPQFAIQEIIRCCKSGFIETPSPIIEIMRGVDAPGKNSHLYCGYSHHHSIIWGDMENNILHILPKKNTLLQNIIYNEPLKHKLMHLANYYPVYWNQYFFWEGENPQVRVYQEDECQDPNNYLSLINEAISCSLRNTRIFLERFHSFQEPKIVYLTNNTPVAT